MLVLVVGIIYLNYLKPKTTSTTSAFTVVQKQHENDSYWIVGNNPNSKQKKSLKIEVKEKEQWTQLKEKKTYILTYVEKGNDITLTEIVSEAEE
ncbi:hypothetical protein [Neobacillus cucumis]|uniref:hypothetical protein n=1 Tax=Neobacillus cucumis TaxID=1740721 RepID=UPI00285330CF|nr:hypothetical protein [Neobacillus cucumis]MDR4949800.1 hypothetical protein [Neobacillus cucumis]